MYAQNGSAAIGNYAYGGGQALPYGASQGMIHGGSGAGASDVGMVGADGGMSIMLNDESRYNEDEIDPDKCPFHYVVRPRKRKTYCKKSVVDIQVAYIIAAIIWVVLIFVFQLYKTNLLGWVILAIPLIVFALNYSNLTCVTEEVEGEMLKGNFLSFAFLITVILINWSKIEDKSKYFRILLLALVFLMLSLVDIWVKPENMPLMRHIRTIFHTVALSLLVFALYMYYSEAIAGNVTPTSVNTISPNGTVPAGTPSSGSTQSSGCGAQSHGCEAKGGATCYKNGFAAACECANLSGLVR